MKNNYWMKLWFDILRDPKMGMLPDRLWRRVIELFLLAGEQGEDGVLPDIPTIAWQLNKPVSAIKTDLKRIAEIGIVQEIEEGKWIVTNFKKRNEPVANSKRAKDFRMRNYGDAKKTMGIYRITCLVNGKTYVGSSVDCDRRISVHFSEANQKSNWMNEDMNRYGKSGFETAILEIVEDENELPERETYWIKQYEPERLYNREFIGKPNAHREKFERKPNANRTLRSQEEQKNRGTDLKYPPPQLDAHDNESVDAIAKTYEQEIGKLTPAVTEAILAVIDDYPLEWFVEAFREAARNNKPSWSYALAILKRWKVDGYKVDTRATGTRKGSNNGRKPKNSLSAELDEILKDAPIFAEDKK